MKGEEGRSEEELRPDVDTEDEVSTGEEAVREGEWWGRKRGVRKLGISDDVQRG